MDETLHVFQSAVDNDNVNIAESFIADVTFVRRKIVSNYKKPPVKNAESKGFEATVFLIFTDVSNWTSEVVVLPVVPNTGPVRLLFYL